MKRILIVGGVAGGASAAARARRLSEEAEIVVFERGEVVSFANCGLPYHIGGVIADQRNLVSFSVLFGMSQNIGGLLGSAILGTFQTWREKFHSSQLADQLTTLNPLITERIQQYSQMYQSQIGDSTLLNVQATMLLQNAATLQANILAYNDTYLLTAAISAATLVWVFWRLIRLRITARIALKRATGSK